MKDTNFVEILPYDEAEILGEELSGPKTRYRVVGLSKSRNLVTLGLFDDAGRMTTTIDCPPHRVEVRLLSPDPRAGAKYPTGSETDEAKHYVSIYQAFVKMRTGGFDEWRAAQQGV
jgi:hypothetical protein